MWGEKIKIKHLVISLMLLCLVMLSAGAAFAASDDIALSEASDDIAIEEYSLTVSDTGILNQGSTVLSTSNDVVVGAGDNIVTNDTFYNYFDETGTLLPNVTSDELIFEGDFSDVGVNYIIISAPIKFTGDNAVFDGVSFVINSDNVTVDGFTVTQTNDVSAFSVYGVSDVTLSNNLIDFVALEGYDSYAVYAKLVDNFNLINNTIFYVGNTDGTVVNNAVRIEGDDSDSTPATGIVVSGNTFDISLPSVDVEYDMTTYEPTVYSEGIVFYFVEDVEFVSSTVEVGYNDVVTAWGYDSLYAVSVKGNPYIYDFDDDDELVYPVVCKNVVIADNNITIDGHSCTYAVFVGAENLTVAGNDIVSTSETYLAHGIDVDSNAVDVMVADNVIVAEAPLATYGICADGYMGPVADSQFINNDVTVTGYSSIGMKVVVDSDPVIADNTVVAMGNYTYGIIANNGVVSGNDVSALGSNTGSDGTGDSYMQKNSVAISVKGTDVLDNTVYSTDVGINVVKGSAVVIDNNIIDVESNTEDINNHAIVATDVELTISNNNITYVGATAPKANYTTAKAYAVYVVDSTVAMENNTLDITVPSLAADWEEVPPGSWNYVRHAYTEGIVFDACDGSSLSNNNITLNYNDGSSGSIYVVDVLDCDDFVIDGNSIIGTGESYLYGIIFEGDDFVISNNTIYAISDYYANGIDIEESTGGIIDSNTIAAIAPGSVYPIYGGMVGSPSLEITNNEIYGEGYFGVGVEFSGDTAVLDGNTIVLKGNYTIGVGVSVNNLTASENIIISNATNVGSESIWDSIGTDTAGIKSVKGTAKIIDNYVSTTGEYAVNVADCEGTVNDNYLLADELLGDLSVYTTGNATVYRNAPVSVLTNDTFFYYFDENGTLLSSVNSDELIFVGDFGGLGVNNITVNVPIKFTSDDAVIEDISFVIASDNVTVDGFTVTQTNGVSAFTVSDVSDVTLSNNIIDVTALEGSDSYAVYANSVENFNLINNTIFYVGNTDGTVVNNAVRIEGDDEDETPATNIVVSGNTFDVQMPSVDVVYDWTTFESTVMNDAIVFYYVEGLEFVDNTVVLEYNDVTSAYGYDSLYAVSVRSDAYTFGEIQSKDVLIANNTIDIAGHACAYGVYVCADDFVVYGNNVTSASETYLAHGIDVDGPSSVGTVAENTVVAVAPLAAYGIYSYQYMGAIEDIAYCDNVIEVSGYGSAGMEIVECNPIISSNEIIAFGNYTYGIIASIRDEGIISGNDVNVLGSNVGSDATGDGLMPKNSMGITVKGDCLIEDNEIISTNIGINLVEDGKITITNNIIDVEANALIDSYGIYSHGLSNVTITDNDIIFVGNTNGTVVNNAVRIEGDDDEDDPVPATNIVVSGNAFDLEIPSVDVVYDWTTFESTVMNDAIVFYYVEGLEFVDNTVVLEYNDVTSAYGYDSLYAVSVRSDAYTFGEIQSKDVLIANNTIDIAGHACAYGVYVCADDFVVYGNNVTSASETYLAHGIDVDGPSSVGTVAENTVVAVAPLAAYGIYSYQYMGAIEDIAYCDNVIEVAGYASAGMEIAECNPIISSNEIIAYGNYTYGIIASIRDEGIISGNDVTVLGSNVGSDATGDGLMPKNSMGISVKGDCLIEDNSVASTDIGINLVEEGQIIIDNNIIDVVSNTKDIANHAIVAKEIDDLTISNNTITYVGDSSFKGNETAKAYAVYIVNAGVVIANNTIDITVPSLPNDWVQTPPGSWNYVRYSYTEGIVFEECDFSILADNNITLGYSEGSYGSIYVVDALDCNKFVIEGNSIIGTGESYLYGIIFEGDDFVISNNTIYAISDYYANGIDIEESTGGIIDSNTIAAIAPGSVYPIYGGMVGSPSLEITNNEIYGEGYFGVGVEFSGDTAVLDGNTIVLKGNYTIGVGVSVNNLTASENIIISNATNVGSESIWDSIGTDTAGIKSVKGTAKIIDNYVSTTGEYAVNVADCEGTVNDNYLISDKFLGDSSVYSTGNATVYNNAPVLVSDLDKVYKDGQTLNVTVLDENGEAMSDVTLIATIGSTEFEATTDDAGQAKFIVDELTPGNYAAAIKFEDSTIYNRATVAANVTVTKADTSISAENITVAYRETDGKLVATLTNVYGTPLNGANVVISLDGTDYALKTNSKGQVKVSTADLSVGNYTATISYAGNAKYNPSSAAANVVVDKADMVISAVYDDANKQIVATLTNNATGNAVTNAKVNVDINGVNTTVKSNSKGKVVISTADLDVGDYTAILSYPGNGIYNPASTSVDFGVRNEMVISAVYDSINKEIVGTLINNATGKVVINAKVNVDINGVNTTVKSNSNGQVKVSTADLPADEYIATISYRGNAKYNPASTSIDFSTKATIIISDIYGSSDELVATLTNSVTGNAVVNANVAVDIDGVTTTVKSNSKGKIKVPVANLTGDKYTATISYKGNAKYDAVSTTATVDLAKANMVIAAVYDADNKQIVGTVVNDATGKAVQNANIKIDLNGISTTVKSNSKGQIIVSTADLDAGTYAAILSYPGNAKYNSASTVVVVDA